MRFRVLMPLAAVAASLAGPLAAQAASPTALSVRSCTVGDSAKQRSAVFYARMRAVPGTARMQMRFTLIDRTSSGKDVVPIAQLAQWRRSRPGVRNFGYTQKVAGLQAGGAYAVVVEFRWLGPAGKTIKSLKRTSADCRQDGKLPNLSVTGVSAKRGVAPGTAVYSIDVANRGSADVHNVLVDLFVDGATADSKPVDLIEAGETVTVHVAGPVCAHRVRAAVDRLDSIPETTEDDNSIRSGCPALSG